MKQESSASKAKLDMLPRLVTEAGAVVYDYHRTDLRNDPVSWINYTDSYNIGNPTAYTVGNPGSDDSWFRDRWTSAIDAKIRAQSFQKSSDWEDFRAAKWREDLSKL